VRPYVTVRRVWRLVTGEGREISMPPENQDHETARDLEWSRLMAAAQDGDRAAYDRLLRQLLPFIRTIVIRQHRAERADDVIQDVLLTIHRVRHTYDPGRPLRYWVSTIARRRSIDMLRRKGRTAAVEVIDDNAYETFADPRANRDIEAADRAAGLGAAIAGLPERQREAVELLKLKEMSLAEASQTTGSSISALKVNVHRAIKALRAQLKGQ
jgi:RNA polymerase sigma-70 factor (ECF subfamily)